MKELLEVFLVLYFYYKRVFAFNGPSIITNLGFEAMLLGSIDYILSKHCKVSYSKLFKFDTSSKQYWR